MKKYYILSLFTFFYLQAFAQSTLLQSGPMVGYSDFLEVALWVQTTQTAEVKIVYFEKGKPGSRFETDKVRTTSQKAFSTHLIANKVQPGKRYEYELYINNKKVDRPYPLEFQTQFLWQWRTDAPDFKFATGSCVYINEPEVDRPGKPYGGEYEIFTSIAKQKPDFMLWLGDNVYLREVDWNSRTGVYHRYTHTRSTPEIQPLLGSTHNYAIWDDHDFGPDNSDRGFANKELTLEAFKDFWANPNYVLGNKGGITGTFQWNDVQFFLLDNRYFRTPDRNRLGDRTMLGQEQFQWLIDALIYSRAAFKVIVIGGQVLNTAELEENYTDYGTEREKLLNAISEAKIPGVVFLDGDRHHTVLSKLDRPGRYPLYDITVSPLTSSSHEPKNEPNTVAVPNTLVAERNFAIIEFKGPKTDRKMIIHIHDVKGNEKWKQEINANDLK
ncbi:alkaline phosphatase D family protein [Xanthocytophaga flava]|uniref:alkaline phosphatase D family protein n=1 Tax=Xanthocytophaga flava TaxID=3048013 RepID=UPI0028D23829|nr:alkaline phosphatase D family protein [Xanthocytophaga flavus]MDJ1472032.1 alkaline phosphatase D family protein [Xanthocytophaga flavus]